MTAATGEDRDQSEMKALIMAAPLQAGGSMPAEELESIADEHGAHRLMVAAWGGVLAGRIGVTWDAAAGECRFHRVPAGEARRRGRIIADVAAGKSAPPWPGDGEEGS